MEALAVESAIISTSREQLLKQRLQLGYYRDAIEAAQWMAAGGGSSFFRSLPTTLAMNVPYCSLMMMSNESLKKWLAPSGHATHVATLAFLPSSPAGSPPRRPWRARCRERFVANLRNGEQCTGERGRAVSAFRTAAPGRGGDDLIHELKRAPSGRALGARPDRLCIAAPTSAEG